MISILKLIKDLRTDKLFTSPVGYFLGVGLGFLSCCLAGYWASGQQVFKDFHRFHVHISPIANYYPTALQMVNLAKSGFREGQIFVIIGGNSILHGYGQKVETLWSDQLQKLLGDRYHVVNLSFEGTAPFEGAYWVAEALTKQGYKVIYVTNAEPLQAGGPPGVRLELVYFDFIKRGLLMDDEVRDQFVEAMVDEGRRIHDQALFERSISRTIDRFAYSQDLWNWIGYNLFYTIWTDNLPCFVLPKGMYADDIDKPPPVAQEDLDGFREQTKAVQKKVIAKNKNGEWVEIPEEWAFFEGGIAVLIPPVMRERSLVLLPRFSPMVTDGFSLDERLRDIAAFKIADYKWRNYGYNSLVVGNGFHEWDYVDTNHFAPSGSQQVAEEVALHVIKLSTRMGYEK